MALHASFKPGTRQSLQAARYFNGAAEEAMDGVIAGLEPRRYHIAMEDGSDLRMRIWSAAEFGEEELQALFEWMQLVHKDIRMLHDGSVQVNRLPHMVENWQELRHGGISFFLELIDPEASAEAAQEPQLSMGVMGGRTVMISTNDTMFIRLDEGVFGLTIAGRGSYLIENDEERRVVQRMRRA